MFLLLLSVQAIFTQLSPTYQSYMLDKFSKMTFLNPNPLNFICVILTKYIMVTLLSPEINYSLLNLKLNSLGQSCLSYYSSDIINYSSPQVQKPDYQNYLWSYIYIYKFPNLNLCRVCLTRYIFKKTSLQMFPKHRQM